MEYLEEVNIQSENNRPRNKSLGEWVVTFKKHRISILGD